MPKTVRKQGSSRIAEGAKPPLSREQVQSLFDLSREDKFFHPLIVTAACTGMRLGDVCNLKWSAVDLDAGSIVVTTTRTNQQIEIPMWMSEGFSLENGGKQLEPFFSKVSSRKQENDLMVPDPIAVYDYAHSLPGNMKSILAQKDRAFRTYLEKRISKERPFFIHKETGAFVASKNK